MRPTSVNRSRTAVAASSGTPRLASRSANCWRVLAAPVSARRQIARATASGSPRSSSPGPGTVSRVRETSAEPVRDRRPRPRGEGRRSSVSSRSFSGCSEVGRSGLDRGVEGGADAELLLDLLLDLVGEVGVVTQEGADVLLALAELVALVRVPGAGLADEAVLDAGIDDAALAAEPETPDQVELRLLERRGDLVLHDLDADPAADRVGALLEGLDAADVEADRRVELQRAATGGHLGRAVDDADLLAQLVDEDRGGAGVVQRTGDLAQRLAHQPGLQADVAVTHLALDLGPRYERGDRVDDDDVERTGTDEHVGDLERLLTGVGLADQQRVGVDADGPGVVGVEGVLGVDERRDAAGGLGAGHRVQGDRRLAGGLGAVHLDDTAARDAADAQGDVQGDGAGRDDLHGHLGAVAQAHDGALAELLVDLGEGHVEGLVAVERCHGVHLREVAWSGSGSTLGRGSDSSGRAGAPVEERPACGRTLDRTSVRLLGRHATRHRRPGRPGQRSFAGPSYSSQMASQTRRTATPASIAST